MSHSGLDSNRKKKSKNGTTLGYHCINSNYEVPVGHSHDFHELLCFIGGDPEHIEDLGAEISICLGDEEEEHHG